MLTAEYYICTCLYKYMYAMEVPPGLFSRMNPQKTLRHKLRQQKFSPHITGQVSGHSSSHCFPPLPLFSMYMIIRHTLVTKCNCTEGFVNCCLRVPLLWCTCPAALCPSCKQYKQAELSRNCLPNLIVQFILSFSS